MAHQQSREELEEHLREQRRFLASSAKGFDDGDEAEAKRLAGIVRTLCRNTRRSKALLAQIGVLDTMEFANMVPPGEEPGPREPIVSGGTTTLRIALFNSPLAPLRFAGEGARYAAELGEPEGQPLPFAQWWGALVLEARGSLLSRGVIITTLANQDGGAHVDPKIGNASYVAATRGGAFGTVTIIRSDGSTEEFEPAPVLATMRAIAHEVTLTLDELAA